MSRTPPKEKRREWSAKREVVPPAPAKDLKEIFNKFSGGASEIDGKTFAKIARDCKIINENCTIIDIDIIFAKAKSKHLRKINFEQFTTALYLCAERREQSMKRLSEEVVAAGGPSYFGTFAEPNRLCDDKTLYTGTCA